jgi:hypothetical protein
MGQGRTLAVIVKSVPRVRMPEIFQGGQEISKKIICSYF